jgi:hypothetical protein
MSQQTAPPEVAPSRGTDPGPSRRGILFGAIAGVVVAAAVALSFTFFGGGGTDPSSVAEGEVPAGDLQMSSTYTELTGAPADPDPTGITNGLVVHPVRETPVRDAPDGRPIARMETTQFGDTWLPVIAEQPGWVQVLLPSKPSSSTGWMRADDVERAITPYVIKVHLGAKKLELVRDGKVAKEWSVGIGTPETPTPTGRTFLLGSPTRTRPTRLCSSRSGCTARRWTASVAVREPSRSTPGPTRVRSAPPSATAASGSPGTHWSSSPRSRSARS